MVGYFSRIKNQISGIRIIRRLPREYNLLLVGSKKGFYYNFCKLLSFFYGINDRILFKDDRECNIAQEISSSKLLLLTSITEVLPIVLLESMASGTPFVATNVGATHKLAGGVIANDFHEQIKAIMQILSRNELWQQYSAEGVIQVQSEYNEENVKKSLIKGIRFLLNKNLCREKF